MKLLSKKGKIMSVLAVLLYCQMSNTFADLNSQLKAERNMFANGIQKKSNQELIDLSNLLTGSGLIDDALYKIVETRLKGELAKHLENPKDKQTALNLNALLRAYASFGRPESRDFIISMVDTVKSRGVRERAHRIHRKLGWFSQRNTIMQDTTYYKEGQNFMTHRFMSLISSPDSSMRRWTAEEIDKHGGTEEIVYAAMADILKKEGKNITSNNHLDMLAWLCKILAKYDSKNHSDLLLTIRNDASYHKKLRRYTKF